MARITPDQFAQNWANAMTASVGKIKAGVQAVSENPMEKAAAQADRYAEGARRAASDGTFAAACRAVGLQQWKDAMIQKGTNNIPSGVGFAKQKMVQFAQFILPITEAISQEIQQMPKGKGAANFARMQANYDKMSLVKYKRRS